MLDSGDLMSAIKMIAVNAVTATKPIEIVFGEVISVLPLKISLEQRVTLTEDFLILTKNVQDYYADVTVSYSTNTDAFMDGGHTHNYNGTTEKNEVLPLAEPHLHNYSGITMTENGMNTAHKHNIQGRKKILVHNCLCVGDNVILMRAQGGQKFIVIDKINEHATRGEWIE